MRFDLKYNWEPMVSQEGYSCNIKILEASYNEDIASYYSDEPIALAVVFRWLDMYYNVVIN